MPSTGQFATSDLVSFVPTQSTVQEVSTTSTAGVAAAATLVNTTGRTTYIMGFDVTIGAATSASISKVAVTGLTNELDYQVQQETTAGATLVIRYPFPIPASAVSTSIVVTVPTTTNGGAPSVCAYGFVL